MPINWVAPAPPLVLDPTSLSDYVCAGDGQRFFGLVAAPIAGQVNGTVYVVHSRPVVEKRGIFFMEEPKFARRYADNHLAAKLICEVLTNRDVFGFSLTKMAGFAKLAFRSSLNEAFINAPPDDPQPDGVNERQWNDERPDRVMPGQWSEAISQLFTRHGF